MSVHTLEIDGRMVTALEGETILAAAEDAGIFIPKLCAVEGLSAPGACRLCMVEIAGQNKLRAACLTRAAEGMVVRTETSALREQRKLLVELLLAEGNHVCSVCVVNGYCELQSLAAALDVDHVRFTPRYPARTIDLSHERFGLDHNRCILCTRCVRACDEIEGAHTLDVAGRGRTARIITDLAEPWGHSESCTGCGKCVRTCPTGALFLKNKPAAEMKKDSGFIRQIIAARREKIWI